MPRPPLAVLTVLLVATGVAACGETPTEVTTSSPPAVTAPSSRPEAPRTLTGEVSGSDVEGRCLVLTVPGGERYQLVGQVADVRPGATVTVRGHVDDGMATTCQIGPAFVVDSLTTSS